MFSCFKVVRSNVARGGKVRRRSGVAVADGGNTHRGIGASVPYLAQSLSCGIKHVLQHWLHKDAGGRYNIYSTRHWYNVSRIVLRDR